MTHTRSPGTLLGATALLCAACTVGASPENPAAEWVGTISTEDDVTTVINEAGSVWGGTAKLVEEASIGVDVGEDAYMLGYVHGIYATGDEIFVLDSQIPVLRVYDYEGRHLRDIGRRGEGPGEFSYPAWVIGTPDGRIYVQANNRMNVFTSAGEVLESIPIGATDCCIYPPIVTADGSMHAPVRRVDEETGAITRGLQSFEPDGTPGELRVPPGSGYEPVRARAGDRDVYVQFAPYHTWAAAPWGAIVGGVSDSYRFEVQEFDGDTLIVERAYEPVAVDPDEKEWWRRYAVVATRRWVPDWSWDGAEMPDAKPAFTNFVPTPEGQIWVMREGPGEKVADCLEDLTVDNVDAAIGALCWSSTRIIDVFDRDGRFLGDVEPPDGDLWLISQGFFVRGRTVLIWVTDDAGVHHVKRYRLVLPGESEK